MKISFLIEVDAPFTTKQPEVKISCDNEHVPQRFLDLAAKAMSDLRDEQRVIRSVTNEKAAPVIANGN